MFSCVTLPFSQEMIGIHILGELNKQKFNLEHKCTCNKQTFQMETQEDTVPSNNWRFATIHGVCSFPWLPGHVWKTENKI